MTRINTNIQALRGLNNLTKSDNLLSTSLTRLSTGLQINNGKDNPSGLIASENLRLQITTIDQSIKNSNRANNVISTADSALGEIGGLLNQIRGLVQEGLNTGALSQDEIKANQSQIDAALQAINRISGNTTFAGDKLIDGSKGFKFDSTAVDAAKFSDVQINEAVFGANPTIAVNSTVTAAAEKAELRYAGGTLGSATTIEVSGAKGSQVLFLGASSTTANIRDAVNNVSDVTGVTASIVNTAPGSLTVNNATAATAAVDNSTPGTLQAVTAGTINVNSAAQPAFAQVVGDNANALLTFSDARAAGSSGSVKVSLVVSGNNTAATTISDVTLDANGDYTVTVDLKSDANGDSTSTSQNIIDAITAHAGAAALVSAAVTTAPGGTPASVAADTIAAAAPLTLANAQDTANNDLVFTDARSPSAWGTYDISTELINSGASQALSVAVNTDVFGNKTVSVNLATDANGNVTSTAKDIADFINTDLSVGAVAARAEISGAYSGTGLARVQAASAQALSDVTNAQLTFTDGRATGANAVFTNNLSVVFANGGNDQALTLGFVANGDGGTLTVNLATDANGNVTSTAAQIKAAIEASSDPNIADNFLTQYSGDGTGVVSAASSQDLSAGVNGANNDLVFTDARATDSVGEFATTTSVQFVNGGANQALSIGVTADANGNKTVTFNVATDANGTITSTTADIAAFLANDNSAAAVEARTLVTVEASGDGTGLVQAKSPIALTGGDDGANNDVTFTDVRTGSPTNDVKVAFVNGGNSQTLSITNSVDVNGDNVVTFNLATDANGNVTSTAADIADFLNNNSGAEAVAARLLISGEASGDGTGLVAARAADALTQSTGDDIVVLKSTTYGTAAYVELNVLNGSFETTLDDDVTVAKRDIGADISVRINGQDAQGEGLNASIKTASLDVTLSFKESSNVVDETADLSITGGGALFQIGQEVSAAGQVGVGIDAINTARLGGVAGKLYELGTGGGKSLLDVGPNVQGAELVDIVDQALNRVSTLRGRLGAIQKNVIDTNVSTLGVALENISAARSQIVDTDFATETANMQKAQVLKQAGISVLAIANQVPQQVLALLR
ncbi:flagellin [Planctellipticum variicoloris]|uniref:flagellin N-terminal helical domain-containing protein n=1 Tax=Planctellipticum variicoloris TaxID=3064265 RepID=UPI003013E731